MEQEKRRRGRPKIDAKITENGAPSRRQAINAMYMYEGVHLITVAATEIPDNTLLWHSDDATQKAKGKNGILEQLGRMVVQDRFAQSDCVYIANLAIAALKNGKTSKEIENAIRRIRITSKDLQDSPELEWMQEFAQRALNYLRNMGD